MVNKHNREAYTQKLSAMFRRRHEVFVEKKRWDLASLPTPAGMEERDQFDDLPDVEYLLMIDEGEVLGSTRFLPTTGPHLSNGPLSTFFDAKTPAPQGAGIWEISRGISAPGNDHPLFAKCNAVMACAYVEWALTKGVHTIIGIGDDRYVQRMIATGWDVKMHGPAIQYPEGGTGMGISWTVTRATVIETWRRCNIAGPVLIDANLWRHEKAA
jgi:N-acyl-L-homoserine lactone synthetase